MRSERELLVDCLQRLNRLAIPYMVAGSMASNYWGIPRSTHDLDFVVALEPADAEGLAKAFEDGFFIQLESIRAAFDPPRQFNAIDENSALKVDFWLLGPSPFDRSAFRRRQPATLFGTPASIITPEDVILHKLYWHRLSPSDRQLQDAAGVYAVQAKALDQAYLQHWAVALDVEPRLQALRSGELKYKTT